MERIVTDSLGFPLTVEISVGEILPRGRHSTYGDETGQVSEDAPHSIEIRAGLHGAELAEVAAHEAYHLFYSVRDRVTADEETQAEVFGHLVKRMHDAAGNGSCSADSEVEECWEKFWEPILVNRGELDLARVKAELFDFSRVMDRATKVYDHVTGGQASKPLTDADVLCSLADDHYVKMEQARIAELEDQLDLNRDEFLRIKVCPGVTDEISGLCDRSQEATRQRVPMIQQIERLKHQLTKPRPCDQEEINSLRARLAKANRTIDALNQAAIDDEFGGADET